MNFNKSGERNNIFCNFDKFSSIPNGTLHPGSWLLPQKSGGIASYTNVKGISSIYNNNLASGQYIDSIILNSGDINANTNIIAKGGIVGSITSNGDLSSVILFGDGFVDSTLITSGSIYSANNSALGNFSGNILGSSANNISIKGTYDIFSDINVSGSIHSANNIAKANITTSLSSNSIFYSVILSGALDVESNITGLANTSATLSSPAGLNISIAGASEVITSNLLGALYADTEILGSGSFANTSASISALISASLSGNNSISGNIHALWRMEGNLNGTANTSNDILAIGFLPAEILGTSLLQSSNLRASASIDSNITSFSELSPENLAQNVWNSLKSKYNTTGTMGKELITAIENVSSGGIPAALTEEQETMLLELWKIMGLDASNPLVVSTTSRTTSTIQQTISSANNVVTVTRD